MKTLNLIAVVESATILNAVEVSYEDLQLAVSAMTTVENCGSNAVVLGTPVSKYFGTEVRMHPVARDLNTGRFVSLKHVEDDVIEVAVEYGADFLGLTIDNDVVVDSQSEGVTVPNLKTKEEEVTIVTTESSENPVFVPEPIIVNVPKTVTPATRLRGGFNLPAVNFEFKEVDTNQVVEDVIEPTACFETLNPVDGFDHMDQAMLDYYTNSAPTDVEYDLGSDVIPYYGADMSNVDVEVEEVKPMDTFSIIREVSNVSYRYFRDNCSLKSFNPEQIRQQFTIVYRKHLVHLHSESELVGAVIKHVIASLTTMYGRRLYVYKDVYMTMLSKIFKDTITKATKKYVA